MFIKKVLLVDYDKDSRLSMKQILEPLNLVVIEAESGEQAQVQVNENNDVDLIMLDSKLPQLSGYDFLVQLRTTPQYVEKPAVIMVTTECGMSSMLSALAAGADEYIMKPFDKDIVLGKLSIIGIQPVQEKLDDKGEEICP